MFRAVIVIIERASEKVLIKAERSPQSYAGLNRSALEQLLLM